MQRFCNLKVKTRGGSGGGGNCLENEKEGGRGRERWELGGAMSFQVTAPVTSPSNPENLGHILRLCHENSTAPRVVTSHLRD